MFNSTVIDIAIGMILTYLLLSLVITAANEFLASVLKWRAKNLADGIKNLLDDQNLTKLFYDHALIKGLSDKGGLPSYIPSRTFALTLLDLVSPADPTAPRALTDVQNAIKKIPNAQVQKSLTLMLEDAGHNLRAFEENIEIWFNNSMDRVSGWYKRKTHYVLLALALIVAFGLNVDSIQIYRNLSDDPVLRASLVKQAEVIGQQGLPTTDNQATGETSEDIEKETQKKLDNLKATIQNTQALGIPIGWKAAPATGGDWVLKILGLLVTAFACSLGAPFWFDLLNKVISIRSSGKSPQEKPKPPKEVPQPLEPGQSPREADIVNKLEG